MSDATRARWIANVDIEPLISAVLRNGLLSGMGLILAGLLVQWAGQHEVTPHVLQANSVPLLILQDLRLPRAGEFWPRLLADLGVAIVMLTPYVRVAVTLGYAVCVERNRTHALLVGIILGILTIVLLTPLA